MSFMLLGILNSQAAGGGGGAAFEHIETINITNGSTQTTTFSSIPTGYKHLQIRGLVKSSRASGDDPMSVVVNGNNSAVYTWHWLRGDGSNDYSEGYTARTYMRMDKCAATYFSNVYEYTPFVMDITDYTNTAKNTTMRYFSHAVSTTYFGSGLYQSTAAVSSLTFGFDISASYFVAGTRLSLYGVK